jgi:ABC-type Fe3+ transport system substrate-binding protein
VEDAHQKSSARASLINPAPGTPGEGRPQILRRFPQATWRTIFLLAFFLLLAAPFIMRTLASSGRSDESQIDASTPRLVVITPHDQDIRNEFRWAFADWHRKKYGQPIELEFLVPGGTSDVRRQLETLYKTIRAAHAGALPPEDQVDSGIQIAWGGGDVFFDRELKPLGILRPLDLSPRQLAEIFPQPALSGSNLYDRKSTPPQWVGVCLSSFGIVYNADVCSALEVPPPQTWDDLTDPRFIGAVALCDPTHSATATAMDMLILQRAMADAETKFLDDPINRGKSAKVLKNCPAYQAALDAGFAAGMSTLTRIAANARYVTNDSTRIPTDVALGDSAAGMAIDFYGRVTEETVGPRREQFVLPKDATAVNPDPVAILYGTHGPMLDYANHFVEFLLSPEGQRLWILKVGQPGGPRRHALRRPPVRQSVYADRTGWADDINYFSDLNGFKQRPDWVAMLPELRPIWAAAWVDDGDDLRDAYRKILAIDDPNRREKLLADLVEPPITRQEVLQAGHDRLNSIPSDLDRARQRLDWAKRFLDHYRQIEDDAAD